MEGPVRGFLVADGAQPGSRRVVLLATDVRQLQLAKAAVRAGVDIVLDEAGVSPQDLEAVYLAGMFGTHLRKASLLALGILPEIDPLRVHFVGNAAGLGARLALVDAEVRARADALVAGARFVDLAARPDYEGRFAAALGFPEESRA